MRNTFRISSLFVALACAKKQRSSVAAAAKGVQQMEIHKERMVDMLSDSQVISQSLWVDLVDQERLD